MSSEQIQAILNSDLIWQIIAVIAMLLLFRSVPQSTIDKLKTEAAKTDTSVDDFGAKLLEWLNANPSLIPDFFKRDTPAPTVPQQPVVIYENTDGGTTVTVSNPPAPVPLFIPEPVGVHGTIDVTNPEKPVTITRNFGVTDSSFEKTVNGTRRVIHTPVNTSPLFSTLDAVGKEYPYPSVNVNSAYGVQFDIAHIAGAWGFTILETLVSGAAYKVRLDYTAQITGDKVGNLAEWLSHELDVNGKVTGVNQGIMNGVSYAEWGITGGHLPVMITPRIRCLWASAKDESKISWQRLTITPVDYGTNG